MWTGRMQQPKRFEFVRFGDDETTVEVLRHNYLGGTAKVFDVLSNVLGNQTLAFWRHDIPPSITWTFALHTKNDNHQKIYFVICLFAIRAGGVGGERGRDIDDDDDANDDELRAHLPVQVRMSREKWIGG